LRLDSRHLLEELEWRPPFTLERALAASIGATSGSSTTEPHD
jgi:hypothetical protein